jgi:predicted house-cleaning noncanonical NTP pyrophosphatase (MazG superfamily)
MKEFMRIALRVTQYLTDKECEELACIMNVVRQTTLLPYDEVDDLSASLAFAKLSTPDIL